MMAEPAISPDFVTDDAIIAKLNSVRDELKNWARLISQIDLSNPPPYSEFEKALIAPSLSVRQLALSLVAQILYNYDTIPKPIPTNRDESAEETLVRRLASRKKTLSEKFQAITDYLKNEKNSKKCLQRTILAASRTVVFGEAPPPPSAAAVFFRPIKDGAKMGFNLGLILLFSALPLAIIGAALGLLVGLARILDREPIIKEEQEHLNTRLKQLNALNDNKLDALIERIPQRHLRLIHSRNGKSFHLLLLLTSPNVSRCAQLQAIQVYMRNPTNNGKPLYRTIAGAIHSSFPPKRRHVELQPIASFAEKKYTSRSIAADGFHHTLFSIRTRQPTRTEKCADIGRKALDAWSTAPAIGSPPFMLG